MIKFNFMTVKLFLFFFATLITFAVDAEILNGNFEMGSLYGWTKTGTAWDDSPETTNYWPGQQVGFGCEGTYFALSRRSPFTAPDAETATGTLRSATFSIPEDHVLSFLICGWSKWPADPSNSYNYVSIKRVSDDTEIERFWAPDGNVMSKITFAPPTNLYNVELYVEVVDNCALTGYAWLGVDDFKVEEADPRNWDFETGTYTNWTVISGNAFGQPTTQNAGGQITGWQGTYYAGTLYPENAGVNEEATGVLRSVTFICPTNNAVLFLLNGWSSRGPFGNPGKVYNYVTLNLASDGTELDRVWAPNENVMQNVALESLAAYGKEVYIEVVDDCASNAYAWIGVDYFRLVDTKNFDFEEGYVGWDVSGVAWGSAPVTTNFVPEHFEFNPIHLDYYANSMVGGEINTGTLKSTTFMYPQDGYVKFLIGGWSSFGGGEGAYNYVALKKASDGSEFGRVYAPGQNLVVERAITNASAYNQEVYMEVVDNCTSGAYAWLSVDYFQIKTFVPEPPAEVTASDGTYSDGVKVTWLPSLEVDKYAVFRGVSDETNLAIDVSGDISAESNEYFDTTGLDNSNYYYWVKAGNSYGWSEFGDYDVGFRSTANPPDKPINQSPADGSLQNFPVALSASVYNDAGGWPFENSKWQLSSEATFSLSREFTGGTTNVVSALSGLVFTGTNYWRVSYQNDRSKWSDWSDSTTFIVERDVNSPYYFYDTFNNVSGSGDANMGYYNASRQYGTAAPLDYSIVGITEVGQSAGIPNKLTLNGVASCSPNYNFIDYTNFVMEFDVVPAASSWTGISFGKISQNAFPVSVGGIGIVFFGSAASATGVYQVFSGETTVAGGLVGAPNSTNMHVKIAVAAESFDNDTAYITMFINGKPMPLRQDEFIDPNPTNNHPLYFYAYEKASGFAANYITLYNNGDVGVIDNFKIKPCSAKMTTRTWESNADLWIGTSNEVEEFTHAVNLNWGTEITVDGLLFEAPGEINILQTNDSIPEVNGADWRVFGADGNISAGQFEFDSAPLPSGTGADIEKYFYYGWGSSIGITLSNLTSSSSNVFYIYGRPFDNSKPRASYISGSDGGIFLVDENVPPDKCQIISYEYLANVDGTFTLTFTPQPGQDYILYGFSSVETGIPEIGMVFSILYSVFGIYIMRKYIR
ncbi:MAG: hypothetical protein DRI44_03225 [Chlamydiae bacterium]|nr:MAG: hypothetical protein DRI44_03225 [Chlamydiota bacterium]